MSSEGEALGKFVLEANPYGQQSIQVSREFVNLPLEKAGKRKKEQEAQASGQANERPQKQECEVSERSNKEQMYYLDGPAAALNSGNPLPGSPDYARSASSSEPGQQPGAEEPTTEDLEDGDAVQQRILGAPGANLWWYFDGEAHRVVKAIRVPYPYTPPGSDGAKPVRTEYMLIGFVGYGTP